MAHLAHYDLGNAKRVLQETLREYGEELEHYKNEVDKLRLQYDRNLMGNNSSTDVIDKIEKRVKEIMGDRPVQSNTQVMGSWKISYPKSECELKPVVDENGDQVYTKRFEYDANGKPKLDKDGNKMYKVVPKMYWWPKDMDRYRQWEEAVTSFVKDRYKPENVVNADEHLSEYCPHVTYNIVPEAISRKSGKVTVSAASCFTRSELKMFQVDLQTHMVNTFGPEASKWILNGDTLGIDDLDDYKIAMDAINDANEMLKAQLEESLKDRTEILEDDYNNKLKDVKNLEKQYKDTIAKYDQLNTKLEENITKVDSILTELCNAQTDIMETQSEIRQMLKQVKDLKAQEDKVLNSMKSVPEWRKDIQKTKQEVIDNAEDMVNTDYDKKYKDTISMANALIGGCTQPSKDEQNTF